MPNFGFVRGLHIDEAQSNIYTTAYEKADTIDWNTATLLVFKLTNGVLLSKIKLEITGVWDMFIHANKALFIIEKETQNYIFEFE